MYSGGGWAGGGGGGVTGIPSPFGYFEKHPISL